MKMAMGEMTSGFDGTSGWMKSPMGTQDLPASQKEELAKSMTLNTYVLLKGIDGPDYTVQFFKDDKLNDKPVQVVIVRHKQSSNSVRVYVDPQNSIVVKRVSRGRTMQGLADLEELLSDYRDVDGVKIPFKVETYADGKRQSLTTISSVKINSGVKDDVFKKP
jgi:hypothetical protein